MKRIAAALVGVAALAALIAPFASVAGAAGTYAASTTSVSRPTLVCDGRHATTVTVRTFGDTAETAPAAGVPVLVGWYLPDGTPVQATGVTNRRGVFRARFKPDTDGQPQTFIVVVIIGSSLTRQRLTCVTPAHPHRPH